MSHQSAVPNHGSITLGGYPFQLTSPMNEGIVNIYGRKVNQGDPGPDDHPSNSTWIQHDWSGGGQVKYGTPDKVVGRFDWSTAETGKTITLPAEPTVHDDPTGGTGEAWAVAVYKNYFWAAWGIKLRRWNHATDAWDSGGNLSSVPVQKGCVYTYASGVNKGSQYLYIPQGAGSESYDGTTISSVGQAAIHFCVWDNKLFRLTSSGGVSYTTDGASWSTETFVPDGSTPRKMEVYMTVGGDPALHVITNGAVFIYDYNNEVFYETQMRYPRHPDQGRGSAVWRGDLWVGVGDGAHRYNRSTIAPAGLDRDDGLPQQFRGVIVDLEPSYNFMFALVSGATLVAPLEDEFILHLGGGDDQMYGSESSVSGLLMRWNGIGWHYTDSFAGTAPTTCVVSDAGDEYGAWYGANKQIRFFPMSRVYFNPVETTTWDVVTEAEWESPWYWYGWEGQPKHGKSFECELEHVDEDGSVQWFYKIDADDSDWVEIGTCATHGEFRFFLGRLADAAPGSTDPHDYTGIQFERIKLRAILTRGATSTAKPVIKWTNLIVRRYLRPQRNWRFAVSLHTGERDYTATDLKAALMTMIKTVSAHQFTHGNDVYMVDVVALSFRESAGPTERKVEATISLIESHEVPE